MSEATGAAGGATGGLPGAQPSYGGGLPPYPAENPAGATSVMPQVPGGQGGFSAPPPPAQPPAPPMAPPAQPAAGPGGFSQPTTYAKGQPTPARGTRVPGPKAARRPGTGSGAGTVAGPTVGRTRRARLRVTMVDPWSVMKVSFLLAVAVGVVIVVATALLWLLVDGLGVFDSLNNTLRDVTGSGAGSGGSGGFNIMDYIGFGNVMLFSFLIAVVNVVLLTALATLSAFIYNTAAGMTGGIEMTLAEED